MPDLVAPSSLADHLLVKCRESGEVLTNLKLQKLLYYSQAWHLALHDTPLFAEDFQAWLHGPVLPSQYYRFRDCQWRPIDIAISPPNISAAGLENFVSEIIEVFGSETAVALELMTHREQPWIDARKGISATEPSTNIIPKKAMQNYYRALGENKAD